MKQQNVDLHELVEQQNNKMKNEAKTITFGIIGAGRIGKLHADNLLSRVEGARLKSNHGSVSGRGMDSFQKYSCDRERSPDNAQRSGN